jgi:hypothetical protein
MGTEKKTELKIAAIAICALAFGCAFALLVSRHFV